MVRFALIALLGFALGFGAWHLGTSGIGMYGNGQGQEAEYQLATWPLLRSLDLETGAMGEALQRLQEQKVRVPGFIVPLGTNDSWDQVNEFVLVPSPGACIHVPPPPPNQMIYVKLEEEQYIDSIRGAPYWLYGTLKVRTQNSQYGDISFQLEYERMEEYVYQ